MIKVLHNCTKSTLLIIKTKDGKQILQGNVDMHDGTFIDTDNAEVRFTEDMTNNRYVCEIEV